MFPLPLLSFCARFGALLLLPVALLLPPPAPARAQLAAPPPDTTGTPRQLADFLAVAYQQSPLLRDYAGQARQNLVDSLVRRAQNGVLVQGLGAAVAAPSIRGRGYDQAVSNGGNYVAIGSGSKPVLNRNILRNDYQIIGNQGQGLRNAYRRSALDLRISITDQFLTAYAAEQQLQFAGQLLARLREQDRVLRALVDGGVYKQTQYLSYYLQVQTQEVAVQQARLGYRRELGQLRYLAGVADTALVAVVPPDPPTHPRLAGLNSVRQRQYTLDSLRLVLERRAVDLRYRPRVSLVLDAGLQSSVPTPLYLGRSFGLSGGVQLGVPIFDGHQRQLQYERLNVAEQIRRGYRAFLTVQRRQQYEQLLGQAQAAAGLVATIREQLRIAEGPYPGRPPAAQHRRHGHPRLPATSAELPQPAVQPHPGRNRAPAHALHAGLPGGVREMLTVECLFLRLGLPASSPPFLTAAHQAGWVRGGKVVERQLKVNSIELTQPEQKLGATCLRPTPKTAG